MSLGGCDGGGMVVRVTRIVEEMDEAADRIGTRLYKWNQR